MSQYFAVEENVLKIGFRHVSGPKLCTMGVCNLIYIECCGWHGSHATHRRVSALIGSGWMAGAGKLLEIIIGGRDWVNFMGN